jgi:hypothetical protein
MERQPCKPLHSIIIVISTPTTSAATPAIIIILRRESSHPEGRAEAGMIRETCLDGLRPRSGAEPHLDPRQSILVGGDTRGLELGSGHVSLEAESDRYTGHGLGAPIGEVYDQRFGQSAADRSFLSTPRDGAETGRRTVVGEGKIASTARPQPHGDGKANQWLGNVGAHVDPSC